MTTSFKNDNPKDGLKWKPRKGKIAMVVKPPVDNLKEAGYWLVDGYTKTPEKLISVKNPSSWGDANVSFDGEVTETPEGGNGSGENNGSGNGEEEGESGNGGGGTGEPETETPEEKPETPEEKPETPEEPETETPQRPSYPVVSNPVVQIMPWTSIPIPTATKPLVTVPISVHDVDYHFAKARFNNKVYYGSTEEDLDFISNYFLKKGRKAYLYFSSEKLGDTDQPDKDYLIEYSITKGMLQYDIFFETNNTNRLKAAINRFEKGEKFYASFWWIDDDGYYSDRFYLYDEEWVYQFVSAECLRSSDV